MAYWYAHLGFLILLTSPLPIPSDPDVPVDVTLMDQDPVLVEGYDAELSCRFHGTPSAVFYHKDTTDGDPMISYTYYNSRSGTGYDSGKYNITDAYSLVIHNVTASDEGRYYCTNRDSRGVYITNDTDATVQTAPRAPFPTIDHCPTSNESSCSLYVNHSNDAVNLTCRAEGASRGLVSLLWSHSGNSEGLQQQNRISPHQDGRTETVEATIEVQNSSDLYVCTAIVHATRFENQTASVTVWVPIATTTMTTTTTTTTTTAAVLQPTSLNAGRKTLIAVLCLLLIAVIIIIVVYVKREAFKSSLCRWPYTAVEENPEKEVESLSYIELWWLCKTVPDLHALAAVTRKLRRQPDETLEDTDFEYAPSRRELYDALCGWKEEVEVEGEELCQRHQLCEALAEQNMYHQVSRLEEFLTTTEEISDDDMEHICWSVRELPKRVKPVLKALGFKEQSYADIDAPVWPIPPRQQERRAAVDEDMQSLLKWRVVVRGSNKMYANENIGSSEHVLFAEYHGGEEASLHLTGVKESAAREGLKGRSAALVNQRVAMCRALEQAGKTDPRYRQVAKNFSLHAPNNASSKRNPTEEEIKSLAIAISSRHCLKLNEKVKLSPGKCKALAEENLDVLFRSRDMLEDWLKEQMCSSYEIRCRLRAAAERAGREDIADMIIRKESMVDPSKPAKLSINQECSTDKTEQPVSYITLEELRWIWRLAGKEAVQKVCSHYKITAEAESTEHGKEADDDLLKELQSKLNTEYASMQKKGLSLNSQDMDMNPRTVVRKILKEVHPSYACLMPKVVEQRFIFDVEITELALRIALRDIYDFAEALGISIDRLTNYKQSFQQENEGKGSFAIVFKLVEQFAKENMNMMKNTRNELSRYLKDLGYRQEARMISFGHSVGIGDMITVAKSEDTSALLRELGVSVSGSNPDVQSKPDFQTTVDALRGWRGAIHLPSFNHRTALVEALYRMDNKPLALGILSGKHREEAMTREMAAQLGRDIPADDDHMSRLCKALQLKERKGMELPSNPADAIMAWAADGKRRFWEREDGEKKFLEPSNSLLRAGFFEVAYEIMAGVTRQQQGGHKGQPTTKPSNGSHDIPQISHENDVLESPRDEDDEEIVTSPSEDAGNQNETALPVTIQVSTEHDVQGKLPQNQPAPEEYHGRAKRTFRV